MPNAIPPELRSTFQAMAEVVYSGDSYDSIYDSLCGAAVELIDGCDHASLMLRRHSRVTTAAASDETAAKVDAFERSSRGTLPRRDRRGQARPAPVC